MNKYEQYCQTIKRMANSAKSLLPPEYQQVEYIQASEGPYINTGLLTANPYITCRFKTNNTSASVIWGIKSADPYKLCGLTFYNGILYVGTNKEFKLGSYDTNIHYIEYNTQSSEIIIDGTVKVTDITGVSVPSAICIGDRGSDAKMRLKGRIYTFDVYDKDNAVTVFNGVPCYRKSDNKPGMYDIITDTFFTNAGTGEFTVGPSVGVPSAYQQVEYLQSTGEQIIDTGQTATTNLRTYAEFELASGFSYTNFSFLFGSYYNHETCECYSVAVNSATSLRVGSNSGFTTINCPNISSGINTLSYRNGKVTVNNTSVSSISTGASNVTVYLFGRHDDAKDSTSYYTPNVRIYHAQLGTEDNVTAYRDLIPCYRKSDNVTGMYDLVNKEFIPYTGTANFIVGPDI